MGGAYANLFSYPIGQIQVEASGGRWMASIHQIEEISAFTSGNSQLLKDYVTVAIVTH